LKALSVVVALNVEECTYKAQADDYRQENEVVEARLSKIEGGFEDQYKDKIHIQIGWIKSCIRITIHYI